MIDVDKLTAADRGRWVKYRERPEAEPGELGRIKSWSNGFIFVVYYADGRWDDYMHFTGEATDPANLEFWEFPD